MDTVTGNLSREVFQKQVELERNDSPHTGSAAHADREGRSTIESIEVTPIVVPLAQEYRGSYYRMRNRATVITRVVTSEGIVGEAYAGDEDSTLADIVGGRSRTRSPRG